MGGTMMPRQFPGPGAVPAMQPGSNAVGIQPSGPRLGTALGAFDPAAVKPITPAPIPTKPTSPLRPAQPMQWNGGQWGGGMNQRYPGMMRQYSGF